MHTGCKNLLVSEPVQWAVDYLGRLLEVLCENTSHDGRWGLALLKQEREELQRSWHYLITLFPAHDRTVFYASGIEAARLFVARHLLSVLPAQPACRLHDSEAVFMSARQRINEERIFLQSFSLPLEEKAPPCGIISEALEIISGNGLLSALTVADKRLHIYSLDYRMPHAAYYLFPSHTVICGAGKNSRREQLHVLLHEFGHILFDTAYRHRQRYVNTLARKKAAERFANRFAAALVSM